MSSPRLAEEIGGRLAAVRSRIRAACLRAGRDPEDVRLIAVSKTFGIEHVLAAVQAGQFEFGENRVQEALQKIGATTENRIRWHLVGHLQSNKVRRAVGPFVMIHSVDRLDLLERLEEVSGDSGRSIEALIQVDLAGETTKFGAAAGEVMRLAERALECRSVRVVGLMLLPPFLEDPEAVRPYFRRVRDLAEALSAAGVPASMLRQLSMGMSHDFEVAIEEGATMVRVGTAIFGTRDA